MASYAARAARGSAKRLFALIYGVGIIVTVLLSNDATAVVLTPAVYAAAKAARAEPLPYLFICAFIANAASFVLPISNPANLEIFRDQMPPLLDWLGRFTVPSILAIAATYVALLLTQRHALCQGIARDVEVPALATGGCIVAWGIAAMTVALLAASAFGLKLGLPTFLAGATTTIVVLLRKREPPRTSMQLVTTSAGDRELLESPRGFKTDQMSPCSPHRIGDATSGARPREYFGICTNGCVEVD